jgi:hypothetical protein
MAAGPGKAPGIFEDGGLSACWATMKITDNGSTIIDKTAQIR